MDADADEPLVRRIEAQTLDRLFAGERARDVLAFALTELAPGRIAVVSSFGTESAVLLHMVASIDRHAPVVFLDTQKHFPETLAYRDELVAGLGLKDVRTVRPDPFQVALADPTGHLNAIDADACCALRKTRPLAAALAGFEGWITGRKRHQSATRRRMPLFERDGQQMKVNPLAEWRAADVADYAALHDLPLHPLAARGYPSVGCMPCTTPVAPGEDGRAGRWRGADKTECGIHLSHNGRFVRVVEHGVAGC